MDAKKLETQMQNRKDAWMNEWINIIVSLLAKITII